MNGCGIRVVVTGMKKNTTFRTLAAGLAAALLLSTVGIQSASAGVTVGIRIGPSGPPPLVVERPWRRPHPSAVWIPGHYHWVHGRYVWYNGYYTYPPRAEAVWVPDCYENRGGTYFYIRGHWR